MSSITIEVDGLKYEGWENIRVTRSIESFLGEFSFQGSYIIGKEFPIKVNDSCKIHINDILVLTGYVETTKITENENTHMITVSGRDRTADIMDNTLGGDSLAITVPITLKQIVEKVLNFYGITGINVIDPYNLPAIKDSNISFDTGQSAEALLQEYASKNNVLITTTADGNIIFQRAGTESYKTVLSTNKNDAQSIKARTATFDNKKRYHKYIITDQANSMADYYSGAKKSPKNDVNVKGQAIDNNIRNTRVYYLSSDDSGEAEDAQKRAEWEANFRRSQSIVYNCTVQGFKPKLDDETKIWMPNMLVKINDEAANLNATLLISSVQYLKDSNGSVCLLKCMTKEAFTNEVNKPRKQQSTENDFAQFYIKPPQNT